MVRALWYYSGLRVRAVFRLLTPAADRSAFYESKAERIVILRQLLKSFGFFENLRAKDAGARSDQADQ
jgi:hypothetical protein